MTQFIVTARSDGRGGIRPFGSYGKAQAGATVSIGDNRYTVGKDGRVNIPKSVMEKYGIKGDDGRLRVSIEFASHKGKDGWKTVGAVITKPREADRNAKTGAIAGRPKLFTPWGELLPDASWLEPYDSGEYNWSP